MLDYFISQISLYIASYAMVIGQIDVSFKINSLILAPVLVLTSFSVGIMMLFYGLRDKNAPDSLGSPASLKSSASSQRHLRSVFTMRHIGQKIMAIISPSKTHKSDEATALGHNDNDDTQPPPFWRLVPGLGAASRDDIRNRKLSAQDRAQLFYPINYHDQNLSARAGLDDQFETERARFLSAKPSSPPVKDTSSNLEHTYTKAQIHEILHDALRHNRVDSFVQPIMAIPDRQILAFEFFGRIRSPDGTYIPAAQFYDMAQRDGVLTKIDNAILINCLHFLKRQDVFHQKMKQQTANININAAIHHNNTDKSAQNPVIKSYFLNISPHTLADAQFMGGLLAFLGKSRHISRLIVLEMRYKDIMTLPVKLRMVLKGLGQIGVRFSVSDFDNLVMIKPIAKTFQIDFIKIPAMVIDDIATNGFGNRNALGDELAQLQEIGITPIADKVENDMVLQTILDLPISMAQGYLFGRPEMPSAYRESFQDVMAS